MSDSSGAAPHDGTPPSGIPGDPPAAGDPAEAREADGSTTAGVPWAAPAPGEPWTAGPDHDGRSGGHFGPDRPAGPSAGAP
ncbi:hypothetical protein ABZ859_32550, partial [Streptomyces sp. NPDC047097]